MYRDEEGVALPPKLPNCYSEKVLVEQGVGELAPRPTRLSVEPRAVIQASTYGNACGKEISSACK